MVHGGFRNQHLTGTSPGLLLLPVQLQLLSLEIELREAWAFPFAQMRWRVLRGRGCYNWITRRVTNHSAGNHSDCGFNLTWSFPSHQMTQPSAAGLAAVARGRGRHPTPSLPACAWVGQGRWDLGTGPFAISVLVASWTGVGRLGAWPHSRQDQKLVVGMGFSEKSSSRSEIGVFPRGRAQAWPSGQTYSSAPPCLDVTGDTRACCRGGI